MHGRVSVHAEAEEDPARNEDGEESLCAFDGEGRDDGGWGYEGTRGHGGEGGGEEGELLCAEKLVFITILSND